MTLALRVDKVSKQYRIYERPGDRLKESITRGRLRRHKEFWALRDIDFQIEAGTTVGIVGPNGCGKSTLLQIISGTLAPTHGDVWHEGRIAALLELGAGFDPEFTGVENVYMNASLLGLSRRETDVLFPAIERFAEIGPFLYQPVKSYSSGMYVRLAFAIAASVDPDILIIDEALAVGDAVFQHRCLRRLKELHERGATVLFVSHDAAAVRALCSRALLLKAGTLIADGRPADVLNQYQKIIMEREQAYEAETASTIQPDFAAEELSRPLNYSYRHGNGSAEIFGGALKNATDCELHIVESGEPVTLRIVARFLRDVEDPVIGFLIRNLHGIHVYGTNTKEQQVEFGVVRRGEMIDVTFSFECWLGIDQYSLSLAVHSGDGEAYDWLDAALFFKVTNTKLTEGVANLNASVTASRRGSSRSDAPSSAVTEAASQESVSYG
jgi:ABC-type polysaccharide/polyol phosphate transport system ATPase subunit